MKRKWWKNLSAFELVAIVSIVFLTIVVVITAIVIANKKQKIDEMEEKNKEVQIDSSQTFSQEDNFISQIYNQLQ